MERLRSSMALVLQDVHLFSGTIASNIRLGSEIPIERVRAAAEAVSAHRFIERLPRGYDTEVTERGSTLSVGQKQLLSFARALAHDPRVLILDEATSSVDTETEQLIQEALKVLMRGRTSIVIAHRLSTVQNVDQILVLHKGRIRERGTHQELLARRGMYFKLYELQYKDQETPPIVREPVSRREWTIGSGSGARPVHCVERTIREGKAVTNGPGDCFSGGLLAAPGYRLRARKSQASVAIARTPSGSASSSTSKLAVWFTEAMPFASLRVPSRK